MIKAVLFDMFETLVTLFEGRTYFGENIASDVGADPQEFRKEWHAIEHDRSTGVLTIEEGLELVLKKLGIYSEEKVRLAAAKRREALGDTFNAIPDDSLRLLEKLKEEGFKTGLITNTFSDERDMIRACPLFGYFDEAMISFEQGICKPDPEIYKRMMTSLNVSAEECLYVGDGGSKELYAARELGMSAVQAAWFREMAFEPHVPCYRLDEFLQAFTQLEILDIIGRINDEK
ncbi:MAG: HAD-IA family hydrolase [Lachnospiraceae bacterium]|nr:HAD-IA family hydrolase [Lachnospiraceae bacterium]